MKHVISVFTTLFRTRLKKYFLWTYFLYKFGHMIIKFINCFPRHKNFTYCILFLYVTIYISSRLGVFLQIDRLPSQTANHLCTCNLSLVAASLQSVFNVPSTTVSTLFFLSNLHSYEEL